MREQEAKNLRINGLGKAAGGTYGKINTDGIATLNGDIVCNSLTSNGTLKLKGSIQAGRIRMNGNGSAEGSISGELLRVDGMLKTAADLRVEQVDIHGMLTLAGNASGEGLELDGGLKLGGNAEFETFKVHGGFQIGGMLNAGTVDIFMAAACQAREIGGEVIRVSKKPGTRNLLALFSSSLAVGLTADVIEGDNIELEETKAEIVRGNSVRIGPGCEIGRVEYKDRFEAHPKAAIGSAEQV
ncbi:hypothetical protein DFP94_10562 [Fontibacillus phaseoli]|uniref:Cytoskeletal protein CcmA (Bactofilin family) n=1 Tax=Fontibacillus phaseoli TaxID=1416533 RepID=A0A369BEQ6_9BACL|nr:hypothetical protein [Fontibacillus phaseoli]RCX19046.1 hypothetical protein DFP94_10562 [Fontibacillus phaseoli]